MQRPSTFRLPLNTLFFKILLYFLSLLIPIVIIGTIAYFNTDRMVKKDVSQKLSDNLRFSSQTIDINLGAAQSTTNNLFSSHTIEQYIKPYATLTDEDRVNLRLVVEAISQIKTPISPIIDEIFLFTDYDRVFTSQEMADFGTFFDRFYRLERYDSEYWKQKLQTSSFFELLSPTRVNYYYGNNSSNIIPSVTTQYVNGRLVTMVANISVSAIQSSLSNNSIFDSTRYLVLDQEHQPIVNGDNLPEETIREIMGRLKTSPTGETTGFLSIDGKKTLVVHKPSGAFGWDYYSITPVQSFSKESASILNLVFWICITLMVIGLIFSIIFSYNLYNPIKNIRNILIQSGKDPDWTEEEDSDELRLIGSRIRALVEQNRNVNLKLSQYSNELLDQFFTHLFRGHLPTNQVKLHQVLEDIGFQDEYYLCCCFLFQYKERFYRELQEPDRLLIQERMKRVLWGLMQPYVNCYVLEYEPNLYVCLVNLKQDEETVLLRKGLDNIRHTFEYDMIYCELNIGIGKAYSEVTDIAKSYSDAITAIGQIKDRADLKIADASGLTIEENYFYSFLDEKKIVNSLKAGNIETLKTEMDKLIKANENRGVSYVYLGALLAELWNTGVRYLSEKNVDVRILIPQEEQHALADKSLTPGELQQRVERLIAFFERIIAETTTRGERRTGDVVSLITTYIEENYDKDIYLEKISAEIGLSAKYVSRMFKETTGTSITDYIGDIRIAKAKKLLTDTDLKISEIASQVGIQSRTTFLRMFKKFEGISPMDYRKINERR